MSHVTSHTICHHETRHIICPATSCIVLWWLDLKMPGNIYQKIAQHYEVLLGPRGESGKLLESTLKDRCFSYPVVIKFTILF